MYGNFDDREKVRVQTRKHSGRTIALAVSLFVAIAIAIGAIAGWAGYAAGKGKVTVLHSEGGETVSRLSEDIERDIADVVETVADSVVEINCTVRVSNGWFVREGTSAGSGVILSEDGTIITNHHVIDGAYGISVRLRGGETYTATLVGSNEENDIAILRISAENLTYATFGDSDALRVGQTAIVIGNPLGTLGGTVTCGILSALDREISIDGTSMHLLQTDASINSGNSGGGMFDLDGRLIGIVNAKSTGTNVEGLGFAIPSNTALQIATTILGT